MNRWQSEYDAEMRLQKRARILGYVLMVASAACVLVIGWLAVVALVIIFGGA